MPETRPWQFQTPADSGSFLLWPDPQSWQQLADRTRQRLAHESNVRLLNVSLADARRAARAEFSEPVAEPDGLWFVTGHQTFPYHPGIWAKNVAVDAAARHAGGTAANINVDHDLPHAGPQICWPAVGPDGRLVRRGDLPLDHRQPFERQPVPTRQQLSSLADQIDEDLRPLMKVPGPADWGLPGQPQVGSFSQWFAGLRVDVDRRLGLQLVDAMSSSLAAGDAFLLLVVDAIVRAGSLHTIYNHAMELVRQTTGYLPARQLQSHAGQIELPFWTLRADRPGRGRLFITAGQTLFLADSFGAIGALDRSELRSADIALPRLRQTLISAGCQLRPRALTLTLFARLLLADLFVHGIGGAIYDHATDIILQRHFGLAAPPFAVATATLRLPLNVDAASIDQLRRSQQRLRDMRFNPQRHLPANQRATEPAATLVAAKLSAIERNAALRNLTGVEPADRRSQRAHLFRQIRQFNRDLVALIDDQLAEEVSRGRQLSERARDGQVALARDYYYGLFPESDLTRLRQALSESLAG